MRRSLRVGSAVILLLALTESISWAAEVVAPIISVVGGFTKKICTLTGDIEYSSGRPRPTRNLTMTRFGLLGSDLGSSFMHHGKLYFLFGDSWGANPDLTTSRPDHLEGDAIAMTQDFSPQDCLQLDFIAKPNAVNQKGTRPYISPVIREANGGTVSLKQMEVPSGGFSANDAIYAIYTTNSVNVPRRNAAGQTYTVVQMKESVLAKSTDDAKTFNKVYSLSRCDGTPTSGRFINVAPVRVAQASTAGLPEAKEGVLFFGTSYAYRESLLYLAYVAVDRLEDHNAIWYYKGQDAAGKPSWSHNEADAVPLYDKVPEDANLGEISVMYHVHLKRWLLLYGGGTLRHAPEAWGRWSEPITIYDAWPNGGYCNYIHGFQWIDAPCMTAGNCPDPCPGVPDRCRQQRCSPAIQYGSNLWCDGDGYLWKACDSLRMPPPATDAWNRKFGATYAPYVISVLSENEPVPNQTDLYFTLSTWNPYQVVLMTVRLQKQMPMLRRGEAPVPPKSLSVQKPRPSLLQLTR